MNTEETTMKNIPTEIYLQVDADDERPEDFRNLESGVVSWCTERIYDTDIRYTLADDYGPALGGRSIQSEGPSASECGGDRPEGQRPDNQLLPQETTTQNIKTADQMFKEAYEKMVASDNEGVVYSSFEDLRSEAPYHTTIELMKAYAKQLIEADRKDCAAQAVKAPGALVARKIRVSTIADILDRPLPKMI